MGTKTIIVLAKSYKHGAWCIAGKELNKTASGGYTPTNIWIRPVINSVDTHGAIPDTICNTDTGVIDVLDVVTIEFMEHQPEPGQPENWLISESTPWRKETRIAASNVAHLVDSPEGLWLDPDCNVNEVTVAYERSGLIDQSLYVIQPSNLEIHLSYEHDDYEGVYKKKITASFNYNGYEYSEISITDPKIRRIFSRQYPAEGEPAVVKKLNHGDEYWLCMSLTPRFGMKHSHYKLIAAIIDKSGYIQEAY